MDYSDLDPFEHSSQRIKEYELSYGDKLSIDLLSLYRSQFNTDVTLVVQSKEFKVHRLILSTRSKYFNDLFQEHPDQYRIELAELFNLDAFQQIIEYIYSGQITVNTNTIDILLPVAEKLRLNTLCEFLGGFYGIELTDANVVSKLVHYHNINNKRGVQQCLLYIDHIITSNSNLERELSKLPFEILLQIVKRKTLDATEAKVLRLMVEWNKQRIEQGEDQKVLLKQMQQLASHLNIYLMCREDPRPLFEILKPNKWITDIELLWSALTKRVAGDNMYGYFNQDNNDPLYKRRRPAPKIVKQQKSSFKVAIFGLKNAGKTSVFKYFLRKTNPNIQQTTLMVEEFDFNGNTIQLRDFNGDEEVRKMWYSEVNKGLDGIIWVVDATDLHEENIDQINSVIDFIGKSIPVLLLAHKSDLGLQAVSPDEVTQFLRITKTMYFSRVKRTFLENYHIIASSITTDLLQDGMKWLVNAMIENIINNRKKGIVRKPI